MFVLIDDDDPAIELLSVHFKSVIQAIIQGTYQQLPPTRDHQGISTEKEENLLLYFQ